MLEDNRWVAEVCLWTLGGLSQSIHGVQVPALMHDTHRDSHQKVLWGLGSWIWDLVGGPLSLCAVHLPRTIRAMELVFLKECVVF